MYTHISTWIIK